MVVHFSVVWKNQRPTQKANKQKTTQKLGVPVGAIEL